MQNIPNYLSQGCFLTGWDKFLKRRNLMDKQLNKELQNKIQNMKFIYSVVEITSKERSVFLVKRRQIEPGATHYLGKEGDTPHTPHYLGKDGQFTRLTEDILFFGSALEAIVVFQKHYPDKELGVTKSVSTLAGR